MSNVDAENTDNVLAYQPNGHRYQVAPTKGMSWAVNAGGGHLPVQPPTWQRVQNNPDRPMYTMGAETVPGRHGGINNIPKLASDGSNYRFFIRGLEFFVKTQGLTKGLTTSPPIENATADEKRSYDETRDKIIGYIGLCTEEHHDSLIDDTSVSTTIENFEKAFGSKDTAVLLNLWEEVNNTVFPGHLSPIPGINFMTNQHLKLKDHSVNIPEDLFCLIIVAKLLKSWQSIKEYIMRQKKEDLKLSELIAMIANTWNSRVGSHSGPPAYTQAYNAKITGVNRYQSAPTWSGQSGQHGPNNRSGNKSGGFHEDSGKNKNANQNQNQNNQNQNCNHGGGNSSYKKKGKGKGKGKQTQSKQGGQQKAHVAALSASDCTALEAEMARPVIVNMARMPESYDKKLKNLWEGYQARKASSWEEKYPQMNFQEAMRHKHLEIEHSARSSSPFNIEDCYDDRDPSVPPRMSYAQATAGSSNRITQTVPDYSNSDPEMWDSDPSRTQERMDQYEMSPPATNVPNLSDFTSSEHSKTPSNGELPHLIPTRDYELRAIRTMDTPDVYGSHTMYEVFDITTGQVEIKSMGQLLQETEVSNVGLKIKSTCPIEEWHVTYNEEFAKHDPWEPKDNESHTFDPADYHRYDFNQGVVFNFLNAYKLENQRKRMGCMILERSKYPKKFNGIFLDHPKNLIEQKKGNNSRVLQHIRHDELMNQSMQSAAKGKELTRDYVNIMVRTKTNVCTYQIDCQACHKLTPRAAAWMAHMDGRIIKVAAYTSKKYWFWDLQHLSQVIDEINIEDWKSVVNGKPYAKDIYQAFGLRIAQRKKVSPSVFNPIFWSTMVNLSIKGKWLYGRHTFIQSYPSTVRKPRGRKNRFPGVQYIPRIFLNERNKVGTVLYEWMHDIPMHLIAEAEKHLDEAEALKPPRMQQEPEEYMDSFSDLVELLRNDPIPLPLITQMMPTSPIPSPTPSSPPPLVDWSSEMETDKVDPWVVPPEALAQREEAYAHTVEHAAPSGWYDTVPCTDVGTVGTSSSHNPIEVSSILPPGYDDTDGTTGLTQISLSDLWSMINQIDQVHRLYMTHRLDIMTLQQRKVFGTAFDSLINMFQSIMMQALHPDVRSDEPIKTDHDEAVQDWVAHDAREQA
ncbi:hypothetical protein PQX77_015684 [Marasmius sp. AFHP31]|nr:hypothetical protein PQX77_015684 [Marasmius sp. AFHP31]